MPKLREKAVLSDRESGILSLSYRCAPIHFLFFSIQCSCDCLAGLCFIEFSSLNVIRCDLLSPGQETCCQKTESATCGTSAYTRPCLYSVIA